MFAWSSLSSTASVVRTSSVHSSSSVASWARKVLWVLLWAITTSTVSSILANRGSPDSWYSWASSHLIGCMGISVSYRVCRTYWSMVWSSSCISICIYLTRCCSVLTGFEVLHLLLNFINFFCPFSAVAFRNPVFLVDLSIVDDALHRVLSKEIVCTRQASSDHLAEGCSENFLSFAQFLHSGLLFNQDLWSFLDHFLI